MSWNYLFPEILLERKFVDDILGRKEGLGVTPSGAIMELRQRGEWLNLKLDKIGVSNFLDEDPDDFRCNASIPAEILVEREQYPLVLLSENESAIILWVGDGENGRVGVHYTSYHAGENNRFAPEETITKKSGYLPMVFLHLQALPNQ